MKSRVLRDFTPSGLYKEPWVELASGEDLKEWGHDEQVAYNQLRRQTAKRNFYQNAFDFIYANEISGDYLEFGCHRARTFRMALTEARHQNFADMRFLAFDSFEGLPSPEQPQEVAVSDYSQGALKTSETDFRQMIAEHGIYVDRVRTFKGFYKDSLLPSLQRQLSAEGVRAVMVCVDCDLYESAVPVFRFVEPFLQPGTLIYIDDYFVGYKGSPYDGVGKAFLEFQKDSAFRYAPFQPVGSSGFSFITCKR